LHDDAGQNISKLIRWPFAAAADGRWKMDKNMRSLNILETMVKVNPQSRVGFGGQGEVYDGKLTLSNGNVVDVVVKFPIVSTFQVISLDNEIGLTTDLLGSVCDYIFIYLRNPAAKYLWSILFRLLGMFTPYVVKSYGWSTINFLPCIVMEKMEMSVSDFLTRSFTLDVESILLTGLNVSNALETMHSFGLFHRDLTSSNVLFNLAPTIALQKHVTDCKVCDFGFVKNFTASTTPLISKVGKGDWFPPEYFLTTDTVQPSPQVDVFNFGMVRVATLYFLRCLTLTLLFCFKNLLSVIVNLLLDGRTPGH
jgi:serine/threonine protein kinase